MLIQFLFIGSLRRLKTAKIGALLIVSLFALQLFSAIPLRVDAQPQQVAFLKERGRCYEIWDNQDGSFTDKLGLPCWVWNTSSDQYDKWILDESPDHYRISNGRIGLEISKSDGAAKYWDPDFAEVRVNQERWDVEFCCQGAVWGDTLVGSRTPSFTLVENSEGISLTIDRSAEQVGSLSLTYIIAEGAPLKHDIEFTSSASASMEYRVLQRWTGIAADRLVLQNETSRDITSGEIITKEESSIFEFQKADGSLSVVENQLRASQFFEGVTIDTQTNNVGATYTFQNSALMTLGPGDSFLIDPETSTFDPPTQDGHVYTTFSMAETCGTPSTKVTSNFVLATQLAPSTENEVCYRTFVEWDISSIDDDATITKVVFKFNTFIVQNYRDVEAREMDSQPSTTSSAIALWSDMGDGSTFVLSMPSDPSASLEQDMGPIASADLQSQLGVDWFALGFKFTDEARDGVIHNWRLRSTEDPLASPRPTLEVTFLLVFPISTTLDIELETSVAASPISNTMVTALMRQDGFFQCEVRTSLDGGRTWGILNIMNLPFIQADPVVRVNSAGEFTLVCLVSGQFIYKSTSVDGIVWSDPVAIVNGTVDKPWLAIDTNPASEFLDYQYLCWKKGVPGGEEIWFKRIDPPSSNSEVMLQSSPGGIDNYLLGCNMDIGPSGEVHVTWVGGTGPTTARIEYRRNDNGGEPSQNGWKPKLNKDPQFPTETLDRFPLAGSGHFVIGDSASQIRVSHDPSIAVDQLGGVHIVYAENVVGSGGDIRYVQSLDCTEAQKKDCNWTTPISINLDATSTDQWEPSIHVTKQVGATDLRGTIHVTALDRRDDVNNLKWKIWHYSCTPVLAQVCIDTSEWANDIVSDVEISNHGVFFIGDYHGITSTMGNKAYTVWTDDRQFATRDFDIFGALIGS